jgi:hypothetical protein
MSNIYQYLLERKTQLELRITEAQLRAQAPFADELNALSLALDALERGGHIAPRRVRPEEASFAAVAPVRRGRKARSTREMILLVLGKDRTALSASDIAQQLARRWARQVPLAGMLVELQALEQEGLARWEGRGWTSVAEPRTELADDDPAAISA